METRARASFGLVLSLGLPFSVIFGPPNALVPLARNKTHKGAALPSISRLDFHAAPRERDPRFVRFVIFKRLRSQVYREFYRAVFSRLVSSRLARRTRLTIDARRTIRANNVPRKRRVRYKQDSASSALFLFHKRLHLPLEQIKTTR